MVEVQVERALLLMVRTAAVGIGVQSAGICEIMALQVLGGTLRGRGVPPLGRLREGLRVALLAAFERDLRGS